MFTIRNYTAVKSFKNFVKAHDIEKVQACIDDSTCNYKAFGYEVDKFFFVPKLFDLDVYMFKDEEHWVVE